MKTSALLLGLVALAGIVGIACGSDGDDEAVARETGQEPTEVAGTAPLETTGTVAITPDDEPPCLTAEGMQREAEFLDRSRQAYNERKAAAEEAGYPTGGDAFQGDSGPFVVSAEEARAIYSYAVQLPVAPAGWEMEITVWPVSPYSAQADCEVRAVVFDPNGPQGEPVEYEQTGQQHKGTRGGRPYRDDEGSQRWAGTHINLQRYGGGLDRSNENLGGWHYEDITIHGQPALLVTVDYYIENWGITWQEDGLSIGVSCQRMTREECIAIAEGMS